MSGSQSPGYARGSRRRRDTCIMRDDGTPTIVHRFVREASEVSVNGLPSEWISGSVDEWIITLTVCDNYCDTCSTGTSVNVKDTQYLKGPCVGFFHP